MFKRLVVFSVIVGVLGMALAVGVSYAGPGDIYGSKHDLGSPGNPTCQQCHVPHDAQGDYLWARAPRTDLPASEALCFSCHDGTVTGRGSYIISPGTYNHPMGPDTHLSTYGDGYCLACHDAHDGDWRFTKDLMKAGKPPNPDNAQVCLSCHTRAPFDTPDKNHPWATAGMTAPNLPLDGTFDPGAAVPDLDGTRLWDSATLKEPVAQGQPGNVTCLSCHGVHGAANDLLTSMTLYDDAGRERLCENCHQ
jgi:predicted CXXCH cytochrome family protein